MLSRRYVTHHTLQLLLKSVSDTEVTKRLQAVNRNGARERPREGQGHSEDELLMKRLGTGGAQDEDSAWQEKNRHMCD